MPDAGLRLGSNQFPSDGLLGCLPFVLAMRFRWLPPSNQSNQVETKAGPGTSHVIEKYSGPGRRRSLSGLRPRDAPVRSLDATWRPGQLGRSTLVKSSLGENAEFSESARLAGKTLATPAFLGKIKRSGYWLQL